MTGNVKNDTVIVGNCKPSETPVNKSVEELDPSNYALDDAIVRLFLQLGGADEDRWKSHLGGDSEYIPGGRENP